MLRHLVRASAILVVGATALYAIALIKSDLRPEAQQFLSESLSPRANDSDLQAACPGHNPADDTRRAGGVGET